MIAQVDTAELRAALKTTAAAIASRPSLPILAGVVIEPSERGLTLSTFDLETSIVVDIAAGVTDDAATTVVPHRLLSQIAAVAAAKQVTITVDGDNAAQVVVRAGKSSEWTLPTLPRVDYPRLPEMPPPAGVVAADLFATAVREVSVAAARAETIPPGLTGILIRPTADALQFEGTDRYRVHTAEIGWDLADGVTAAPGPVLTPARAVKPLTTLGGVGDVELSFTDTLFAATAGHVRFTTRLLDGSKWPSIKGLMKPRTAAATTVAVDTAALTLALRQVEAGDADRFEIHVETDRVRVIGRDSADQRLVGEAALDATVEGDPLAFRVDTTFFGDALDIVGDQVELQLTAPHKPILVATPGHDGRLVVMPARMGQ